MNVYCQKILDGIEQATSGMSTEALMRHPEGQWCTGEVLEHLSITYGSTVKGLKRALEAGKPLGGVPTLKQRVQQFVLTEIGYFPAGRRAPQFTVPKGLPAEECQRTVRENLAAMDAALQSCEEQFGSAVKIADHPVLGPLTAPQWRRFHLVHARHHMKQIARLRSSG